MHEGPFLNSQTLANVSDRIQQSQLAIRHWQRLNPWIGQYQQTKKVFLSQFQELLIFKEACDGCLIFRSSTIEKSAGNRIKFISSEDAASSLNSYFQKLVSRFYAKSKKTWSSPLRVFSFYVHGELWELVSIKNHKH